MSGWSAWAAGCWLAGWLLLGWPGQRGPVAADRHVRVTEDARILRLLMPLIARLAPPLERLGLQQRIAPRLQPVLDELEFPWGLRTIDWCAVALIFATMMSSVTVLVGGGKTLAVVAGGAGAALPFLLLRDLRRQRRGCILGAFPDLLDTIALLLRAGRDSLFAIEQFAAARPPGEPLVRELRRLLGELRSGARLIDALQRFEQRLAVDDLNGVMAAWRQGLETGAVLADLFAQQAEELRHRRFERAEQAAAQAAIRLAGPLLMIFAAVLLIVIGPLLLQLGGLF